MFRTINKISLFVIGGICTAAITDCSPTYQSSAYGQGGTGFEQAQYGYDYVSGQSAYDYAGSQAYSAGYSSRYGEAFSVEAELRGPCGYAQNSCGMMRVVPVYPVYQVAVPQAPEVQSVEVPTITITEPEPLTVEIFEPEPEPVYEPVTDFWPEPETPIQSWEPLRK